MSSLQEAIERALAGGPERHHEKSREQGKLGVRERIALLLDAWALLGPAGDEQAVEARLQRRHSRRLDHGGRRSHRHRSLPR